VIPAYLVAIEKLDSEKSAQRLFERIVNYRIFPDVENRMNLSLNNIQGGLLLIPQFTLAADTNSGNRCLAFLPVWKRMQSTA
jgi:D-tyrosyl-tRNA(Tyr) deacylase